MVLHSFQCQLNLTRWRTREKVTACRKYHTRYYLSTGRHDFHVLHLFEKAKLTNHSTNEPEILHANRFSSKLVQRLIISSLTVFVLVNN